MSQTNWVYSRLKKGPLTALDALNEGGIFRLAARVNDLRNSGYNIITINKDLPNGKRIAEYRLGRTKP